MKRTVAVNALVLAGLKVAVPLFSFLLVAGISRKLGAAALGRYSMAYLYLALLGLIVPLGLPALLTREGVRDKTVLGRLLYAGMVLSAAVYLIPLLCVAGLSSDRALGILTFAALPLAWSSMFDACFLALERTTPIALASLAENLIRVGGGLIALRLGGGLDAVLSAAVAGSATSCLLSLAMLRRLGIRPAIELDGALMRMLARRAPVFALSALCATLYWRIDIFLLSALRGMTEVGYYTAAYRILDAAVLLPQNLCHALYPRLARGQTGEPYQRWLIFLTAPAALLIAAAAHPLMRLLYGPGFDVAAPALAVLIWTAVPWGWNRYQAYLLVAADRQRIDLGINASALALNVLLNCFAIPQYGALGAALVTLATAVAYGALQFTYLKLRLSHERPQPPTPQMALPTGN